MNEKNTARGPWLRLLKAALLFCPLLVLVAAVNVKVDPASLFQRGYEADVAAIVTSGQNAAGLKNMDDRVFQQNCAQLLPYTPHTLVLGASRGLQLTAQITGCQTLFNTGVTNGDLRDMVSFYQLYCDLDKRPQRVILMTDYSIFNENKLDSRAYVEGYAAFAAQTGTKELKTARSTEKWRQLFSPTYFQTAISFLTSGTAGSDAAVPTSSYETDSDMRRYDGSYSYGPALRERTEQQRLEAGKNAAEKLSATVGAYAPLSPVLRQQFELFIDRLQADGVQVILQLPPINPQVYAAMAADENYINYLEMEEYFHTLAEKKQIQLFGSYDAAVLGLTETDFYDGLHCSMEATASYFPQELRCDCGEE